MATKAATAGYLDHRPGSRKGDVHRQFDKHGRESAFKLGEKLKLKEATVRSWTNVWAADGKKKKKVAVKKAAAKKAAPKKKVAAKPAPEKKVEAPATAA